MTDRLTLYRSMLRIRMLEERLQALYGEDDMRCPVHFSLGQEAVAVGVCSALGASDYVISAHRSHAHYLARGGDMGRMVAEFYGKATGCAGGKGGSMHLVDRSVGFLGCVPIVGATIPIGVGAAFGQALHGRRDGVVVVFFGDAAVETGAFHESLNFAALHALPVLFVCENNYLSVLTPIHKRQPPGRLIVRLAAGMGVPASAHDGFDVESVSRIAHRTAEHCRSYGPVLVEFRVPRWTEHCGPTNIPWHGSMCPLKFTDRWFSDPESLLDLNIETANKVYAEIKAEIDAAIADAKAAPFPDRAELRNGVYA